MSAGLRPLAFKNDDNSDIQLNHIEFELYQKPEKVQFFNGSREIDLHPKSKEATFFPLPNV